jgi:hypothetical protein
MGPDIERFVHAFRPLGDTYVRIDARSLDS